MKDERLGELWDLNSERRCDAEYFGTAGLRMLSHHSALASNESISRVRRNFLCLCTSTCLLSRYLSYLLHLVKVGWSFVIHVSVFREISLTSPISGSGHPSDNSFQTLLTWIWFESQIKGLAWNLFSSWFFLVSMSVDIICIPFILGITLSVD